MNKHLDYARHYANWHPDTDEHFDRMRDFSAFRIRRHLPKTKDVAIVDVGCGMGFLVSALQREGFTNVKGIDIDQGQIAKGLRRGLPVELVTDTVAWLQQNREGASIVFCYDVIEHVPIDEQVSFISSIYDAMTEDGVLVCSVPNANSSLSGRYRYIDYTHTIAFTEHSLDFLLYHSGFRQILIEEDEPWKPRYPFLPRPNLRWWYVKQAFRLLRRLQFIAELGPVDGRRAPLSLNLLAVAKK